jgi:hypothetical protein
MGTKLFIFMAATLPHGRRTFSQNRNKAFYLVGGEFATLPQNFLDGGELALTPVALAVEAMAGGPHRPHAVLQVPLVLQVVRRPLAAHVCIPVGRLAARRHRR